MCATCGCGETDADVEVHAHAHPHPHDHPHSHDHDHDHDHGHAHDHDHAHGEADHEHRHAQNRQITLEQSILARNQALAERNRGWFSARRVLAVNLMSAPGSGKTTLLARTARERLGLPANVGAPELLVIEGDQATQHDADRIRAAGCRALQINTGTGCHLDASMIWRALEELDPPTRSLLMIENVGNLVCPALFDLGEQVRVVVMSVTEGEDKPLKYPHMFQSAHLVILNKCDLLPHLQFDVERCLAYARQVNRTIEVLTLSATSGEGMAAWYRWLLRHHPDMLAAQRHASVAAETPSPLRAP